MIVRGVLSEQLDTIWPHIAEMVAGVCQYTSNFYDPSDVYRFIKSRDMQLWLAISEDGKIKSLTITEIVSFPKKNACRIVFCTGEDAREWVSYIQVIEGWAKSQGAVLQLLTRPGWEKLLKEYGYKKTHVVLEKGE